MAIQSPDRGDVVWINFSPHSGHEQGGRRPALVLSPFKYNNRSRLAVVCPVTKQAKDYPFEVPIPKGFPIAGVILADHVKSVDWTTRNAEVIFKAPDSIVLQVEQLVLALIKTVP